MVGNRQQTTWPARDPEQVPARDLNVPICDFAANDDGARERDAVGGERVDA